MATESRPQPQPQPQLAQLHARALDLLRAERRLPAALGHVAALPPAHRASCLRRLLRRHRLLPLQPLQDPKRSALSELHRTRGNRAYASHRNAQALHDYNAAIACAPADSPELALAYGNRSAVLLTLGKPEECLRDISRALTIGYEESRRDKLIKRKQTCSTVEPPPPPNPIVDEARRRVFKPPSSTHPDIPCASSKLILSHDDETGRKIVTSADILPGEVLAVEQPYIAILLHPYLHLHCYNCCEKSYSLIPCETCSAVMFCSETCRTTSWNTYHRHECRIVHYTQSMGFSKLELLALRVVLKARSDHESWDALRETATATETETNPEMKGFTTEDGRKIYDSRRYASIHALETNAAKRGEADIFQKAFSCAVLLDLLAEGTDFFDDDPSDENANFAGGLLLHHIMTATCNMHTVDGLAEDERGVLQRTYDFASGAYAFMSLLNHSCNPNVIRQNVGIATVLLCLRPIKKGEEVLDCYGPHYALENFIQRLERVDFQYKFQCNCRACVENWPTYAELPSAVAKAGKELPDVCDKLTPEIFTKLQTGDQIAAIDILDDMYKYVTALENYIPCKELADYQETIKQCWGLLGNVFYLEK